MSEPELDTSGGDRFHARYIWGITVVTGIGLWVLPMFSSFWLDETVTWWVIKDDLGSAIDRALEYQQSPLYYVMAWVARRAVGSSEFAVRLPSLVFAISAAWLMFRLALRLHDREVARLVVFAFVASPWMALVASDARPYALGILAIVAAGLALVRWLDGGGPWDGLWFTVACAVALWAHYLFVVTVIALCGWGVYRTARTTTRVTWRALAASAAGAFVLVAPLVGQLISLAKRSDTLTIPGLHSLEGLMTYLLRPAVIGGLILGVLFSRLLDPMSLRRPPARLSAWMLWVTWATATPLTYFVLALLSPFAFLAPRYWSSAIPGLAALTGAAVASIQPARSRRTTVGVMALVMLSAVSGTLKFGEEWRDAASFVRSRVGSDTPVLLQAGLIESDQLSWLVDPRRADYLTTPAAAYDFGTGVVPMPYRVNARSELYFEHLIDAQLADVDRFLLVGHHPLMHGTEAWLDGHLESEGFDNRRVGAFGAVYVVEFTRRTEGS